MKLFHSFSMILFLSVVVVCLFANACLAYELAGGIGDSNDPYQIVIAEQLINPLNMNILMEHYDEKQLPCETEEGDMTCTDNIYV